MLQISQYLKHIIFITENLLSHLKFSPIGSVPKSEIAGPRGRYVKKLLFNVICSHDSKFKMYKSMLFATLDPATPNQGNQYYQFLLDCSDIIPYLYNKLIFIFTFHPSFFFHKWWNIIHCFAPCIFHSFVEDLCRVVHKQYPSPFLGFIGSHRMFNFSHHLFNQPLTNIQVIIDLLPLQIILPQRTLHICPFTHYLQDRFLEVALVHAEVSAFVIWVNIPKMLPHRGFTKFHSTRSI